MLQFIRSLYLGLPTLSRDIFGEKMWHEGGFWETTYPESQVTEPSQHSASPKDIRVAPLKQFSMLWALDSNLILDAGRLLATNIDGSNSQGH